MNHAKLSEREREVMKLLAQGKSPKQIGEITKQTRRNVHNHLTKIKDKLGAETTYQSCAIFGAIHHKQSWLRDIPQVAAQRHPWKRF